MERTLRPLLILLALLSAAVSVQWILGWTPTDWRILAEAGRRAGTSELYQQFDVAPFHYSPFYAYLLVPLAWIGPSAWAGLHVAAAFAFGSPRITALLLVAFPFWHDALSGNVLVFVLLAAWWALRGNRLATFAYLALCLLMPRPLMAPVAVWLLWQRPEWRLPFAAMFGVHAVAVLATGLADDWARMLLNATSAFYGHPLNWAPSRWIGAAWMVAGLPLAAWLTWKGRLGLASLAASPYLFPYYFLFGLLDVEQNARPAACRALPSDCGRVGRQREASGKVAV